MRTARRQEVQAASRVASVVTLDPRHAPAATRRELWAQLDHRGIARSVADPVGTLRSTELAFARRLDPRVSEAQYDALVRLSAEAARMVPEPQRLFFGFSRLLDAKFDCSPRVLQGLIDEVLRTDSAITAEQLMTAIEQGPPGEEIWSGPESPWQLVASLIRQIVNGRETSVPINMAEPVARWLEDALTRMGRPLKMAMGGAAAFGANVAAVLNADASKDGAEILGVDFFAWEDHAPEIAAQFGPNVHQLDRSGLRCAKEARVDETLTPRRNYVAAFPQQRTFRLRIGDRELQARPLTDGGRFILGTPVSQRSTFGDMTPEALARIGRSHDRFFLSGAHYQTLGPPGAVPEAEQFRSQLDAVRTANPKAQVHIEYAKAKLVANEALLMRTLSGAIDSLSLNPGSEGPGLFERLKAAGMVEGDWRKEDAEAPAVMLAAAEALLDGLDLKRLHLHGFAVDLLVIDGPIDPRRQVLSLLRARQAVTNKAANPSGEIKVAHGKKRELWPVYPTFPAEGLAAEQAIADALQRRFGLSDDAREQILRDRFHRDPASGRTYVFAACRRLADKRGGTVGAGDTIDLTAWIFGRAPASSSETPSPERPRRLRRVLV